MSRRLAVFTFAIVFASVQFTGRAQRPLPARWIAAWAASQNALGMNTIGNTTVRMIARVTIPGDALRVRLDNTYGTADVTIGSASVGPRVQGAGIAAGVIRPVSFNGASRVVIPAGGTVVSDAVIMKVLEGQDLAVSLFVPGTDVRPSVHTGAVTTSYLAPNGSGDLTAEENRTRFTDTTTSMFWLNGIDVSSTTATGAVVAFGDSITDGTCATLDANNRWEDWVALRMQLDAEGRGASGAHKAIVNEGIGGNTITREVQPPPDSMPGRERLDRDVLSHVGVTHAVLFMGTNDIRRNASAAQVIAGTEDIIRRVKARGLRIVGVTIIPRHNSPASGTNTGWDTAKTQIRNEVNQWIRAKAPFDGIIDFDRIVRDPANADMLYPPFNCGDGTHPSPRGYFEMGRSVRLDLFREPLRPTTQ